MTKKAIKTYASMNRRIKEILTAGNINYELYAARRIEELEREVVKLKKKIERMKKKGYRVEEDGKKENILSVV